MDTIIIGGGIGGLATALALRNRGIEAHVFEAAPELREVGAGITMPPNAMQLFGRLGVAEAVRAAGCTIRAAEIHDLQSGLIQAVDMDSITPEHRSGIVALHRARLQYMLAEQLPAGTLHLGMVCSDVSQTGDRVQVKFRDGSEVSAGRLIAADGLRSSVRQQLFPGTAIRYSGQTSYRGVAQYPLLSGAAPKALEIWSAGRRFGFVPISADEVYWFAVEDAAAGGSDRAGTLLHRLKAQFSEYPAPVGTLLDQTAEAAITRTDLCDLRPLPTWYAGRVALLGDAAHATTPNLGQGGAQAIEDAWSLAACVADHTDVERAFSEYQNRRKLKADRIVNTSWWIGKMAHLRNPLARAVRNTAMRFTPAQATARQMRFLFDVP